MLNTVSAKLSAAARPMLLAFTYLLLLSVSSVQLHSQLPYRDNPIVIGISDLGKPFIDELSGVTASGSGLWMRSDTVFSAHLFGAARYIAYWSSSLKQWRPYSLSTRPHNIVAQSVSPSGQYIFLGYDNASMELSSDGGRTFNTVPSPTTSNTRSIAVSNEGVLVVARVPEADIFTSLDQGVHWQPYMLPRSTEMAQYGRAFNLKFDSRGSLSFGIREVLNDGVVVGKLFYKEHMQEWRTFIIGGALSAYWTSPSTLYVSTSRPVPGRTDATSITELMRVNLFSGNIDTVFSFIAPPMTSISDVWAMDGRPITFAMATKLLFTNLNDDWMREPIVFPANAEELQFFVQLSPTEIWAMNRQWIIRLQLAPVSSVHRLLDADSLGNTNDFDRRLPSHALVYDLLGRLVHTNPTDAEQEWLPHSGGVYLVYDPITKRTSTIQY